MRHFPSLNRSYRFDSRPTLTPALETEAENQFHPRAVRSIHHSDFAAMNEKLVSFASVDTSGADRRVEWEPKTKPTL